MLALTDISPVTKRIKNLKKRILEAEPTLCYERAMLVTEAYKMYGNLHPKLLRAKVLEHVLHNMSIYILPGELIVGNLATGPYSLPLYPEFDTKVLDELDTISEREFSPYQVSEETKEKLKEIAPYWKGKSFRDVVADNLPEKIKKAATSGLLTVSLMEAGGIGHYVPDLPTIFKFGFGGLRRKIQEKLEKVDLTDGRNYEKVLFWKACIIECNAIIHFGKRFAKLANELAKKETDPKQKWELEQIAKICEWIPENPPRTFWEALQMVWFVHLFHWIETNGVSPSPGRLDVLLYPYYKRDMEEGRIAEEFAQELIDNFWLKFNQINRALASQEARYRTGRVAFQAITLGGIDKNGNPVENELTRKMLIAEYHISGEQPQISLWVHEKTPEDLLLLSIECIKRTGKPQFMGIEYTQKSLARLGIPPTEARDVVNIGCAEPAVIGAYIQGYVGHINLAKVLELTLNNGRDMLTGELITIETGDPSSFTTFEGFFEAFRKQLEYAMKLMVEENHILEILWRDYMPHIYQSMLIPDCIEKGLTIHEGGARYEFRDPAFVGYGTTANSLVAIKKAVFEDKIVTMEELVNALRQNWEGYEDLRKKMLKMPKYGNDDDYADNVLVKLMNIIFDTCEKFRSITGATYAAPTAVTVTAYAPFGAKTATTPDGRLAGKPLSDAFSPASGTEQKGPTAVLKSAAKVDHWRGLSLTINMKFSPTVVNTLEKARKFIDFVKTFLVDMEGSHIQFNIVSSKTLREAQQYPEKYKWLIVRVAGYSAYFVHLSKDVQEQIIKRTEWEELRG